MTTKTKRAQGCRSIAFMLASLHSGSSVKVWPELAGESERQNCTCFIFPGGRLGNRDEYEYMRNSIFSLVRSEEFDGILSWASSLSGFTSEAEVAAFHRERGDAPLVTFGLKIDQHPAVTIDAYSGMKRLVFHLARRHKCRRIAFIGGPREHSSAEHRFRAYRDALRECGIEYDERLASLDNPWTEGRKAMRELIDGRGLVPGRDFDALCGASDLLIFEAAKLLRERNIRIPSDLAIGGFNDSDESHLLSPTYTTVHMPFDRQALQAFRMLLQLMDGKAPEDCLLKTHLVIRQSCGCLPVSVERAGTARRHTAAGSPRSPALPGAEDLAAVMAGSFSAGATKNPGRFLPAATALLAHLGGSPAKPFLDALDLLLSDDIFRGNDIGPFQDMLTDIRAACDGSRVSERLESIVSQARVLVSDAEKRRSNYRVWKEKALAQWLGVFNHELLCAKDFPSIVEVASRYMPRLGIRAGYFVLAGKNPASRNFIGGFSCDREEPTDKTAEHRPGQPRLYKPHGGKRAFPAGMLLPEEYRPHSPGAFAVLPLYYESTSLGYCVLAAHDVEGSILEEIRVQVSGAMRSVRLFEQVNEARKQAERAEKLKTSFLAGVSEEMQRPLASILSLATRLLESPEQCDRQGKAEIEAIAAQSSRQLELTRRLMDLSLAQVDQLALEKRLLDPAAFLRDMVAELAARKAKTSWGNVRQGILPSVAPLFVGDPARITQIFEIFLDYFFHELGAGDVEIGVGLDATGLHFAAEAKIREQAPGTAGECEKARDAGGTNRAKPEMAAGGTLAREMTDIEIDLARKIAFMQGGQVSLNEWHGAAEFVLSLPYPSLDDTPRLDAATDVTRGANAARLILGGGAGGEAFLSGLFPPAPTRRVSLAALADSAFDPETADFVFLDPAAMAPEEAVMLSHMLDDERFRRIRWFVRAPEGQGAPRPPADGSPTFPAGLAEYLRSLLPSGASAAALVLGPQGSRPEARQWLPPSVDSILCRSLGEFSLVVRQSTPALVVLAGQDNAALESLSAMPELAEIPLVCASAQFSDSHFEAKAMERPLTLLLNAGETFTTPLASRLSGILKGDSLLPAATGATITRAIFFLNRHFREPVSRWKLSESLAVSEDYLSRIFRHQTGMSLWEYLSRLRIGYAINLLRTTGESVSEIAAASGFQDQAYFCRVFHRVAGTTPGSIRKSSIPNVRKVQEPD